MEVSTFKIGLSKTKNYSDAYSSPYWMALISQAIEIVSSEYLAKHDKLMNGKTFQGEDALWDCVFTRIRDYIRSIGAEVEQEIQSEKYRPKWNDVLDKIIKNGNSNSIDCFYEKRP